MMTRALTCLDRIAWRDDKRAWHPTYTTLAVANMLAELGKYGVGMILANYKISDPPELRGELLPVGQRIPGSYSEGDQSPDVLHDRGEDFIFTLV
jgi:hypothetical protein